MPRQVEIGVVGDVRIGGSVRLHAVGQREDALVGERVDGRDATVARQAELAVRELAREPELGPRGRFLGGIHRPQALVQAVHLVRVQVVGIGVVYRQVVHHAVDRHLGTRRAVGDGPRRGAVERVVHAQVARHAGKAERDIGNVAPGVGHVDAQHGGSQIAHANRDAARLKCVDARLLAGGELPEYSLFQHRSPILSTFTSHHVNVLMPRCGTISPTVASRRQAVTPQVARVERAPALAGRSGESAY